MLSLVAAAGIAWQTEVVAAAGCGTLQQQGAAVERTFVERTLVQAWPRWQMAFTDDDVDELRDGELDGQSAKLAFEKMAAVSAEGENEQHNQQGSLIEDKEPEIRVRGTACTHLFPPSRVKRCWRARVHLVSSA